MKFTRYTDIGSLEAEDDKLLIRSFVVKEDYEAVRDVTNQKCIVLGRTGSGKSAILRMLEEKEKSLVRIKPEEMSLRFLSNSDILEYFRRLDIKLDLFYKVLWKHVFIVEILKLHYGKEKISIENRINSVLERIEFSFNKKKKKAVEYLRKWHDKFWESTEYRVKELESRLRDEFKSDSGFDAKLFDDFVSARLKDEVSNVIERSKKIDVINKAQKIVNEIQIDEISTILEFIRTDLTSNNDKKFFIIIDDLDKEWVDSKIAYDLIVALIQTVKEINSFGNIKIIVSLRLNLYQLCLKKSSLRGTQREKFSNLLINVFWSESDLKNLLLNRVKTLYQNAGEMLESLEEILPSSGRGNKISGLEYIFKRSLYRPRDVISFFNKAMKYSDGNSKISRTALKMAESEYSVERLLAVEDEWRENHPMIKNYLRMLTNKTFRFRLQDLHDREIESFCKGMYWKSQDKSVLSLIKWGWEKKKIGAVRQHIINTLYQIGLVGIKPSPNERVYYSYQIDNAFDTFEIDDSYFIYVNPAFYSSLHIRDVDE